jgi:hypothetical protein
MIESTAADGKIARYHHQIRRLPRHSSRPTGMGCRRSHACEEEIDERPEAFGISCRKCLIERGRISLSLSTLSSYFFEVSLLFYSTLSPSRLRSTNPSQNSGSYPVASAPWSTPPTAGLKRLTTASTVPATARPTTRIITTTTITATASTTACTRCLRPCTTRADHPSMRAPLLPVLVLVLALVPAQRSIRPSKVDEKEIATATTKSMRRRLVRRLLFIDRGRNTRIRVSRH